MKRAPDVFEHMTTWIGSPISFFMHTLVFAAAFGLGVLRVAPWDIVLLTLTTLVSLEAIYLSIFIQMTVNRHSKELEEVSEDVEDIQEDLEEISEDIEEVQKDMDEIQEDVEDIQEDLEEISEDETEEVRKANQAATLEAMTKDIQKLLTDLEQLKKGK